MISYGLHAAEANVTQPVWHVPRGCLRARLHYVFPNRIGARNGGLIVQRMRNGHSPGIS